MMLPWRLHLREARQAMKIGQLDQAGDLIRRYDLGQYEPGRRLSVQLADKILKRGRQRADLGDSLAAWNDLNAAAALGGNASGTQALGDLLTQRALAEAERYLAADDPQAARERLGRLPQATTAAQSVRVLQQTITHVEQASQLARCGLFAQADAALGAALSLRPDWKILGQRRATYRVHLQASRELLAGIHQALAAEKWHEVLRQADRLLEFAPGCEPARSARRQAWNAVSVRLASSRPAGNAPKLLHRELSPLRAHDLAQVESVKDATRAKRFLLWIDSVGGFLVCPGKEVLIGQPSAGRGSTGGEVDIPILADLSRRHARVRREGEGYLIEPLRPVRLDGRPVLKTEPLVDGQIIELGQGVELRFRRPHPLSSTARLDFVSGHRTPSAVDGVILMADTCVLADRTTAHVICRRWPREVVLFQRPGGLGCRAKGGLQVDGVPVGEKGELAFNSQVSGEDFSFSIEEV